MIPGHINYPLNFVEYNFSDPKNPRLSRFFFHNLHFNKKY